MTISQPISSLYEQDFQLWLQKTIEQLQNGEFESLDIAHLVEELGELGKSQKNALESDLMILLAHLLKLSVRSDAPITINNEGELVSLCHRTSGEGVKSFR